MAVSLFAAPIYRDLMRDAEIAACFEDTAEIRAWLRAEAALAAAQAELGLVPAASAQAIAALCESIEIDPARLAGATARDGIPIPELLAILRAALADEHAGWLHYGATTQDIVDTGLVLRLRDVCDIVDARLRLLLQALADLAEAHAELPMIARTRRRPATPSSFGALVAAWGAPLLTQLECLAQLRPRLLRASLGGAAGNAAALGPNPGDLRVAFAARLELGVDDLCWHTDRTALGELAALLGRVTAALAKMAEDCLFAAAAEVGELRLPATGGSSTLPHKQNPVHAETLLALHEIALSGESALARARVHRQQRDGAAWLLEWQALPQACLAAGRALQLGIALAARVEPVATRMAANIDGEFGLVYAEAIGFRLARELPRAQAQAEVRRMCAIAVEQRRSLPELVGEAYPDVDWQAIANPAAQLGDAPLQARRFAARVRNG